MKQGYTQILWLLGEESKITEAGAMNFFAVIKRDDGGTDSFFFRITFALTHLFRQTLMS